MRSSFVGVPSTDMIDTKWSSDDSEKKRGSPRKISAITQPTDQTSIAQLYPVLPNASSGAR